MTTMRRGESLIETLNQWKTIANFLSSFDVLLLRASCLRASKSIVLSDNYRHGPNWMLIHAAGKGHRDLCILTYKWAQTDGIFGPSSSRLDFDSMLYEATLCADPARGREICELARTWGASDEPESDSDGYPVECPDDDPYDDLYDDPNEDYSYDDQDEDYSYDGSDDK